MKRGREGRRRTGQDCRGYDEPHTREDGTPTSGEPETQVELIAKSWRGGEGVSPAPSVLIRGPSPAFRAVVSGGFNGLRLTCL